MPSPENPIENLPATRPQEELLDTEALPEYKPLPELSPDQAKELTDKGVLLAHLFDMETISKASPDDFRGHKKAMLELLGALYGLIDTNRKGSLAMKAEAEDQDDYMSKANAKRWTAPLENALRELGYIPEHLRDRL